MRRRTRGYARTKIWAQLSLILYRYPSASLVTCGLNPEKKLRPNDVGTHGICRQCITTGHLLALLVGKAHPPPMNRILVPIGALSYEQTNFCPNSTQVVAGATILFVRLGCMQSQNVQALRILERQFYRAFDPLLINPSLKIVLLTVILV